MSSQIVQNSSIFDSKTWEKILYVSDFGYFKENSKNFRVIWRRFSCWSQEENFFRVIILQKCEKIGLKTRKDRIILRGAIRLNWMVSRDSYKVKLNGLERPHSVSTSKFQRFIWMRTWNKTKEKKTKRSLKALNERRKNYDELFH